MIAGHPAVAECAVTGIYDELRGQVPVGFVVLKDGVEMTQEQIQKQLVEIIRRDIGAVACFRQSCIVKRLPKTRSGKILRKTISKLAVDTEVSIPPTIDDPVILDEIRNVMRERGIGQFAVS